jgi:hypothetical protein
MRSPWQYLKARLCMVKQGHARISVDLWDSTLHRMGVIAIEKDVPVERVVVKAIALFLEAYAAVNNKQKPGRKLGIFSEDGKLERQLPLF